MKKPLLFQILVAALFALSSTAAMAQSTAFSYQGRLKVTNAVANGTYDFQFSLCSAATGSAPVGTPVSIPSVPVTNGLFNVVLDFGSSAFTGPNRWLAIAVSTNLASSYTTLSPRQQVLPNPYAISAQTLSSPLAASQLSGTIGSAQLSGIYSGAVTFTNIANSFGGNGNGLTNIELGALNSFGGLAVQTNTPLFVSAGSRSGGAISFSVAAGDLNGDGFPDLLLADVFTGALTVLTNDQVGWFSDVGTADNVPGGPFLVVAADLTSDSKLDVVIVNSDNSVTIGIGNGDGTFAPFSTISVGANLIDPLNLQLPTANVIAIANLDLDTHPDLVLVDDDSLIVLNGAGDGTFTPGPTLTVGSSSFAVFAVDLNDDGKNDLLSVSFGDETVSAFLSNGSGGFSPGLVTQLGNTPYGAAVADVDGDGNTDLITSDENDTLTILLNDGTGSFFIGSLAPAGSYPNLVSVGDFNGDGLPDLISSSSLVWPGTVITLATNVGDGTFEFSQELTTPDFTTSMVIADFNHDVFPDFLAADFPAAGVGAVILNLFTNNNGAVIKSTHFAGDGSGLVNIPAANLTGTIMDRRLSENVALLDRDQYFSGENIFDNDNNFFWGDGSGLFNLDAASLSGSIGESNLPGSVPLLDQSQTFTGDNTFSGVVVASNPANQFAGAFAGDGSSITSLNGANLANASVTADKLSPSYGYFYYLNPGDSLTTIAMGASVPFPNNGPTNGITRVSTSEFQLEAAGIYEVTWQASISESGQLMLALNNIEVPWTVVGRAAALTQIYGNVLVETSSPGTILSVVNPSGNPAALSLTSSAGGSRAVTGSLVIKRIK